jgi:flagellar biosynthesis protein FlhF
MRIRKFEASDMREALALVKRELGPDAMVISTRQLKKGLIGQGGVEVTAAVDEPEQPHTGGPEASTAPQSYGRAGQAPSAASSYGPSGRAPQATPAPQMSLSETDIERIMAPLRSELRSLRTMVRAMSEPAPGRSDDVRAELNAMRQSLAAMQMGMAAPARGAIPGELTLGELAHKNTIATPSERRVVVVVGPTGVGKTTTIAKLAARASLVAHEKVAILTLDSYRVGGEEQMRTYADLIGVPLTLVPSPQQLGHAIASCKKADRIFVDTAGRSPRDAAALTELAEAILALTDAEVHLAMPAGLSPSAMDTIFKRFSPLGLDRLLFTKLDEADDLAELVRAPVRMGRAISHITTGQRVPEDFEDATTARLLDLATRGLTTEGYAA